ncbi:catecholate siderophore receptor Fiu [Chitinimonas koreensis]|uniref:catecholate siderophore receptor Fiu n=1 Tax=Chitinimonas koreensis TaxID=356302 RepID=UPI0027E3D261|nr:catecholate siderophore receptor Fiu [Chitinimonas koreensis]
MRDLGSISRDTFNTEQVEIAKGPAGADYGRGAASGYVNLVSKNAQADDFTGGAAGFGSGDYKRVTADINRKLGFEGAAFRLNLMKQDAGVAGRDEVKNDRWGVAPSLAFGLDGPTRAYFNLLHIKQDNRPDGGVPTVGLDGFYNAAFDTGGAQAGKVPAKVDSSNFYGSLGDFDTVTADMFTARFEHDFAQGITLRNTSRYGKSSQQYVLTGVNAPNFTNANPALWTVARTRQGKDQDNTVLTNQTNLTAEFATGAVKHSVSAGIEFIYEKQAAYTQAGVGTQAAANLYNPSVNDTFIPVRPTGAMSKGDTATAGIYVFDTLKFGDRFQLNGGLRVDHYKTESESVSLSTAANNPTLPVGTLVGSALSGSDNLVSWKIGALYKPAANGSVYASYATSQQPPGGANFALNASANNINNPNVDPQEGSNIELGTKWDLLGNKLAVTAALFRSENKNEIVTNASTNETTQVGKRRVEGVELGVAGIVTQNWQISAGLAYMDPKISKGSTGGNSPTDGGVIQWSPKLTFTSWTTYKLPFGLTIGGGARYVDSVTRSSSTIANPAKTNMLNGPDYWVFDAMAAYEINKNVNLQLNVYNLADKEYIGSLNNSGARYSPGTPRSARLTANFLY